MKLTEAQERERLKFEAFAEREYRNAADYTKRDYEMGLAGWLAARAETPATPAVPTKVEEDAARYRWIRGEHQRFDPICHLSWKRNGDRNCGEWVNTANLDASVDLAIEAARRAARDGKE